MKKLVVVAIMLFPFCLTAQEGGEGPEAFSEGMPESGDAQAFETLESENTEKAETQPVVREFKPTEEVMADTVLTLPADI